MRRLLLLLLVACTADPAAVPAPRAAPPSLLAVGDLQPGQALDLEMSRVVGPVVFFASTRGHGPGPCAPGGSPCLGLRPPVVVLGRASAALGRASLQRVVPSSLGGTVAFQAYDLGSGTLSGRVQRTVGVANRAPTAPTITVGPTTSGDDLVVVITTPATDPDGDDVAYTYAWSADGAPTPFDCDVVPASATSRGQLWQVAVTATDGAADSPVTRQFATIRNSPPSFAQVRLVPRGPDLEAVPTGWDDPDADPERYLATWWVGGAVVLTGPEELLLPGVFFGSGDDVRVDLVAADPFSVGTTRSASVTVP